MEAFFESRSYTKYELKPRIQNIELKPGLLIWTENKSLLYELRFIPEFSDSNVGNDVKMAELSSDALCVLRNTLDRFAQGGVLGSWL